MKYWNLYTAIVKRNCSGAQPGGSLAYWRDNLFAGTIIYLLPLCLIALVPGLYWVYVIKQYVIAAIDLVAVVLMLLVAFAPRIPVQTRKILFITCFYIFSCAMLYYVGMIGPGLLYLLTATVFCILIFPVNHAFWPSWINTGICGLYAAAIFFNLLPAPQTTSTSVGEWVAVSSNLIFFSFLSSALIPRLFNGLQQTIEKEQQLQQSLQNALEMVQQKNDELEQFTSVASHDMKEPLRMISSFMALLKSRYGEVLDERAHSYIDFAADGGKRMQRMIADLLELSRAGIHNRTKELTSIEALLQEVQQNIYTQVEESGAQIIIASPMPGLPVYPAAISSLFQNLLSNAIKFSGGQQPPVVTIQAEEKPEEWLFSVSDNGIGIKPENAEKIFDIFTRLHTQHSYEGSGIGLAVCKKIVGFHEGRIWVEPAEGKGSTFFFTLKK
jgi:signal transduction histidine kinase